MSLTKDQAHSRASALSIETRAFIDGAFTEASDGGTFDSVNPATGETLCAVAHCAGADVDRAVAAARARFNDGVWSRAAPEDRLAHLLAAADGQVVARLEVDLAGERDRARGHGREQEHDEQEL